MENRYLNQRIYRDREALFFPVPLLPRIFSGHEGLFHLMDKMPDLSPLHRRDGGTTVSKSAVYIKTGSIVSKEQQTKDSKLGHLSRQMMERF